MAKGNIKAIDNMSQTNVDRIQLASIRLECLKLGYARQGAHDLRKPLEIAEELYGWVMGSGTDQKEPNDAATPSPKGRAAGRKDAPGSSR